MRNKINSINRYDLDIIRNYFFKISNIILSFLLVRLTIAYLGSSVYGLWVTIVSIVSWMASGDLGIGNGLRNQLAEAFGKGDTEKEKEIICTGIISLGKIAFVLFLVICVVCEILIQMHIITSQIRIPLIISGGFFAINLFLGLSDSISYSHQKSWYVTAFSTLSVFLNIVIVYLLFRFNIPSDLVLFSILSGLCVTIPKILLVILIDKKLISIFKLNFKNNKKIKSSILSIGLAFFGLQICSIVLYSTDNVIINYLFDGDAVTKYSVITKIYDTGQNLFSIILISLWSAVTYHFSKNDIQWIKNETRKILIFWVFYVLGVIAVSFLLNPVVSLWLGAKAYHYEPCIIVLFCLYGIATSFSAIFVNIVNGLGKIKLQLIIAVFGAILNIPLSIFLAKFCNLGILGVKLATFCSVVIGAIIIPIQVIHIFKNNNCIMRGDQL